ncbi:MAG: ferrous iron transport protein B [Bacteroidales bacterium]|nr:ferrous iron transport protein B [Bacteroidales bacterium]
MDTEYNNNTNNIIKIAVVGNQGSGRTTLCQKAVEMSVKSASAAAYRLQWEEVEDLDALGQLQPDVVVNVVNAVDVEYSLLTTARLIERHLKLVMALNHYDELLASDHNLDYKTLGSLMGFHVVPTDAITGLGFAELQERIVAAFENQEDATRHVHVKYSKEIESAIKETVGELVRTKNLSPHCSKRHLAVQLLEDPRKAMLQFKDAENYYRLLEVAETQRRILLRDFHEDPAVLIQKAKNGFVAGALNETLKHSEKDTDHTLTQKIDSVLTSKWLGFPILIGVLYLMFQCTFALGAYPQSWIASGVNELCLWIKSSVADGWFSSLCVDGVVQGVGAVVSFLPNIIIMFFFLSMLEDSGYMSRAAFLMDKIMHRIGLHGRSFIPMLIGFGCNVPAIMAAREIDNWKDRALTMLMIPFMSCSARLPVYLLFVSVFFEVKYRAIVILSLYIIGILLSVLFAIVMKRTRWFRQKNSDFVSELPPYRRPTLRNTGRHIWERCWDYLQKIASVILWASIIIWALEYFPRNKELIAPIEEQIVMVRNDDSVIEEARTLRVRELQKECIYVQNENSYLAKIGRFVEPVTKPLGFDWRMNVCLITGLPAKEAIVSTIGILYHVDVEGDGTMTTAEVMRSTSNFSPLLAFSFMLFVALYFPCVATMGALKREIGWRWAAFSLVTSMSLAWLVSFLIFQIGALVI